MKNSPWAKLIKRATPSMSASPAATIAYMAPSVRPCSSGSKRSVTMGAPTWPPNPQTFGAPRRSRCAPLSRDRSIQERRARRQLLENVQLPVAHLDQDHVDPRLVIRVELDRTKRRLLDVDLLERGAD